MIRAYRTDDIRAAEEPLLAAGEPLMQRAATALAYRTIAALRDAYGQVSGLRAVALIGAGNNGGDGLYALARLRSRGVYCTALLGQDESATHTEALAAARTAGVHIRRATPDNVRVEVGRAHVVLDALLGIGARGVLREPLASIVSAANEACAAAPFEPVMIAVDVPTGINADDGTVPGEAFRADMTVTMGAPKPGLILDPGRRYAGDIHTVDLDFALPATPALVQITDADVADLWRIPGARSHKYTRGVVGMMTGSRTYVGAGVLSVAGALRAGAGMVRYVGQSDVAEKIVAAHPEVVTMPGRVQAWVLGSGVDMNDTNAAAEVARRLHEAVSEARPVVVDAGAVMLAATTEVCSSVVLTPHAGEISQLLTALGEAMSREEVEANPARAARLAATVTGATVLLKGAIDIACAPDGPLYVATGAPGWRGVAGVGDVLAGTLGAVLAMWGDELSDLGAGHGIPARLAAAAAHIHARAAALASGTRPEANGVTYGGAPITASDIAAAIPNAVRNILAL